MTKDRIRELIEKAAAARGMSYAPYSHYRVGAALLSKDGRCFTGCNIENAAYTPSNCAERTAFFKAVSEGIRDFQAIAIVGSPAGNEITQLAYPCGVCRQVMMEFCDPKTFQIIVARSVTDYQHRTLEELLPCGFGPDNLSKPFDGQMKGRVIGNEYQIL
ncbi:MAG: cytidine deaminase [Clostridiales bacterium]|nr:cytidine deaminase [Clostridiales bacterium]